MRKTEKILIISIMLITIFLSTTLVMAKDSNIIKIEREEYTEEYKKWLELDEEERAKVLEPRKYKIITEKTNVINNTNNIFKISKMLKSSTNTKYSLNNENVIPENTKIRNQQNTNWCWAFATIGVLETNLAMLNKKNSNPLEIFDFSERHMVYSCAREAFENKQINEKGFNMLPKDGGNAYKAEAYLTNGGGAVSEEILSFENNENNINISKILNKEVETTLYDTIQIEQPTSSNKQEIIEKMKAHISNYGGLYAGIHGASLMSSTYYNNKTGAIYCDNAEDAPINHAVVIIGWDDNYSKENFKEEKQPENNGAWIIKNSWGDKIVITIEEAKEEIFLIYKSDLEEEGITSAGDIPEELVDRIFVESGYTKGEDSTYTLKVGDNGYMYVSYDDVNIYNTLWGIQKATSQKDYYNLYQNDVLGYSNCLKLNNENFSVKKYYLANVFKRDTTKNESLDKISINTIQDYNNCKVYVNPNGSDKNDLQEVELKIGETIDIVPGYHTIEFEKPVKLTGESFVVVLEIEAEEYFLFTMESKNYEQWKYAEVNSNESFFTTDLSLANKQWIDTATITKTDVGDTSLNTTDVDYQGNINIKAFTVKNDAIVDGNEENTPSDDNNGENSNNDNQENGNNNKGDNDNQDKQDKEPTASDFKEANATVVEANISVDNNNSEASMKVKISGIKIGDEENIYTYYYCLSGDNNKENIEDEYWIKISSDEIKKENDGTYTITLYIDQNDLKNFKQIENTENLYIFIKEVAEINNKKLETVNNLKITLDVEPEINNDKNNNKTQFKGDESDDKTVANKIIPYAGKIYIILTIIGIIILGSLAYFRYKNIDR